MALLYIRQYTRLTHDEGGHVIAAGQEPGYDIAPITFSGTSASVAIRSGTKFVRLTTDAACNFVCSADPNIVATTNNARMAAGQTEFFGVSPGLYIAVIAGV